MQIRAPSVTLCGARLWTFPPPKRSCSRLATTAVPSPTGSRPLHALPPTAGEDRRSAGASPLGPRFFRHELLRPGPFVLVVCLLQSAALYLNFSHICRILIPSPIFFHFKLEDRIFFQSRVLGTFRKLKTMIPPPPIAQGVGTGQFHAISVQFPACSCCITVS